MKGWGGVQRGNPDFKWWGWSKEFWGLDILDSGIFLGRKNWRAFFLGTWFKKGFFGYSKQSEDSDGMMNKQTQTFNFYSSYFSSYIIYSLLQMLRLRNLAWDVFGVNFWSGFFWGVLLEALRIFWGFDFCPHSIIRVTWNPEYPQPWGEGELIHKGCCLIFYMYMYGLWGGHLFGGGRLLEREFILGNTVIA